MGLSKAQQTIWERARALGAGEMGVALSDVMCAYLVGRIALDLGLGAQFGDAPTSLPAFFDKKDPLAPVSRHRHRDSTAWTILLACALAALALLRR